MFSTFAKGKLLLTGEYVVLDGAEALALPLPFGQQLEVVEKEGGPGLHWESVDHEGRVWFSADFNPRDFAVLNATDSDIARRLGQILLQCRALQPDFCQNGDWEARIRANFPLNWGLGSSSTLLAALARWAGVDPYALLAHTFGGSGYDIACAYADTPIIYTLAPGGVPQVRPVDFNPPFKDSLYFYYLGQKQDSREGIRHYRSLPQNDLADLATRVSALTRRVLSAPTLEAFEAALLEHEQLLSATLQLPRAQDLYFPDFPGVIKSLGAWGGDFVLATRPLEGAFPYVSFTTLAP